MTRLSQHKATSGWFKDIARITVEHFEDRIIALNAERAAVQNEQPKYNIQLKAAPPPKEETFQAHSRDRLVRAVASFQPTYSLTETAQMLGIGLAAMKRLIEAGKIGHIVLENGRHNRTRITGWQLIEFLEAKQAGTA